MLDQGFPEEQGQIQKKILEILTAFFPNSQSVISDRFPTVPANVVTAVPRSRLQHSTAQCLMFHGLSA